MVGFVALCYTVFLLFPVLVTVRATDILNASVEMTNGSTLVSAGKFFEFGFFTKGKSSYLGIWYCDITPQTVVWVANRNAPLNDTPGVVKIVEDGSLILQDNRQRILWSTNLTKKSPQPTILQLLDSGNLVLRHDGKGNTESYLWESFDNFTDTWLPGMKFGKDSRTGLNRYFTSWKSQDDPSTGEFTYSISPYAPPLQFVLRKGNATRYRTGPWNGASFSFTVDSIYNLKPFVDQEEIYFEYVPGTEITLMFWTALSYSGEVRRSVWNRSTRKFLSMYAFALDTSDTCDNYGHCGVNSICTATEPIICSCLTGYKPKSPQDWNMQIWSGGCIRKHPLNCSKGEDFVEVKDVKVPDKWLYWMNTSVTLEECKAECLKNCSCTGYANSNISGKGSGCLLWYGDLIDIKQLSMPITQNLYLRLAATHKAELSKNSKGLHGKKLVITLIASAAGLLLLVFGSWLLLKKRKVPSICTRSSRKQEGWMSSGFMTSPVSYEGPSKKKEMDGSGTSAELVVFDLRTIVSATENFSFGNKLGQGGFGSVYKGRLHGGQEIAVKRLSQNSGQGVEEFKNEVSLIARLQHRNLVRLFGCCIQQEEKMLVYEYLPNKGLDNFIFDKAKGSLIDWGKRFDIILGVARGLVYLHRDSRLRIIHRDLKASNVLLDAAMEPKISDFGMARIFGTDQMEANTTRVVGTYGYMSPEYAMQGLFSDKSDVFSFGVLLVEIISGKKNNSYYNDDTVNLIGHVWNQWRGGNSLDIVEPSLGDSYQANEVMRCIHVGLLCVQEHASDRPTMAEVLSMLCNETTLSEASPNQPAYVIRKGNTYQNSSSASAGTVSVDDVSITTVQAR